MTKQELQEKLKALKVKFTSKETKDELQEKLESSTEVRTSGKSYGTTPDDFPTKE